MHYLSQQPTTGLGDEKMRYYIEQAPDRFYDSATLASAKPRAARLSKSRGEIVYIIAERFDPSVHDYVAVGSISYANGLRDAVEGDIA